MFFLSKYNPHKYISVLFRHGMSTLEIRISNICSFVRYKEQSFQSF